MSNANALSTSNSSRSPTTQPWSAMTRACTGLLVDHAVQMRAVRTESARQLCSFFQSSTSMYRPSVPCEKTALGPLHPITAASNGRDEPHAKRGFADPCSSVLLVIVSPGSWRPCDSGRCFHKARRMTRSGPLRRGPSAVRSSVVVLLLDFLSTNGRGAGRAGAWAIHRLEVGDELAIGRCPLARCAASTGGAAAATARLMSARVSQGSGPAFTIGGISSFNMRLN